MPGPIKYAKEVIAEGKKVRWPKRDVWFKTLLTVIVIAGLFALVLALEDYTAASLISQLKSAFGGME